MVFLNHHYVTGSVWKEWFYKNGEKDSLWTTYYENGKIEKIDSFKNGFKTSSKEWDENGLLLYERCFNKNKDVINCD